MCAKREEGDRASDREADDLAAATRRIWDRNAAYWDEHMQEGNDWHLRSVRPATEKVPRAGHASRRSRVRTEIRQAAGAVPGCRP